MLLSFAIFAAATAAPLEVQDLEMADCENEVGFYDEADSEVVDSQEIVLIDEELENETGTDFEEN